MWSFISGNINYIKIGLYVVAACGIFYSGFHIGNQRYLDYKSEVEVAQKAQEQKVESIRAQQELINKGIQDEYDAKLALLRQYYANGVRQPTSTKQMSTFTDTAKLFDASAAYAELAGNCAQTTLQLVELQKWINEQIGIK